MTCKNARCVGGFAVVVALGGCSQSNNLLLGRVEATVGEHTVVVTDCYRTSVPAPEQTTTADGPVYRFMPCRDADVVIRRDRLVVNGRSYGPLGPGESVTVDHGEVLVNNRPARVQ
jgi:hypothetical protein